MIPDKATILLYAFACEAAYEEDDTARAKLLDASGLTEIAYLQGSDDARALLCMPTAGGPRILAFQGTQFTRWELASIFANLDFDTVDLGGGRLVHGGYYSQVQGLAPLLDGQPAPDIVTGHSMGGSMAELYANRDGAARYMLLLTFGAPKCANAAFWAAARNPPVRIVNERDPAPLWPPWDGVTQPGDIEWLHRDGDHSTLTDTRNPPVTSDVVGDHFLEAYIPNLEVLS